MDQHPRRVAPVPIPGHTYVGGAIFGVYMPVLSVFIAVALLLGSAVD